MIKYLPRDKINIKILIHCVIKKKKRRRRINVLKQLKTFNKLTTNNYLYIYTKIQCPDTIPRTSYYISPVVCSEASF